MWKNKLVQTMKQDITKIFQQKFNELHESSKSKIIKFLNESIKISGLFKFNKLAALIFLLTSEYSFIRLL